MQNYILKRSDEVSINFLKEILKLDSKVYPSDLQGDIKSLENRFLKNKESYQLLYTENNTLIGYICYFPITNDLSKDIYKSSKIHDDDITEKDIVNYSKTISSDVYVISVVIDPDYRDGNAVKTLTEGFEKDIKTRVNEGYLINNVLGTAISDDGRKFLSNMNFKKIKNIENGYTLMGCKAEDLMVLKDYKDDIYIMIPFDGDAQNIESQKESFNYMEAMDKSSDYECNKAENQNFNRKFIGRKQLIYMNDTYTEIGKEKIEAFIYIASHVETQLNVLTIAIFNNKLSVTQIQDQIFSDHLYIDDDGDIVNIIDYMKNKYNLTKCGDTKSIICLSKKPRNNDELTYMLAGETYNGEYNKKFEISKITSKEIEKDASENVAQYNFYEAYVSKISIIYILNDFNKDINTRIEYEALILFIAELSIFQNAAIKRTNIKIVNGLSIEGNVSLKFIENLYKEFGKTIIFWDKNNFKYLTSQNLADIINKKFEMDESFETYYRNQNFLEHIVDLKNAQSSNRENLVLNIIAIILALLQVVPVFISAFQWLRGKDPKMLYYITPSSLLVLILILIIIKRKKNKR